MVEFQPPWVLKWYELLMNWICSLSDGEKSNMMPGFLS